MDIIVNANSKYTIYEQIVVQIKKHIVAGEIKVGESLPSIRVLARALEVSVISVQRAYEELQKEGIIESVPGKGCFVSSKLDKIILQDTLLKEVEDNAKELITLAKDNNVELDELIKVIKLLWES